MRSRSLSLLCPLFLVSVPHSVSAQTRFDQVLRELIADLDDPARSYDAVDRLQAIGPPAIPALLAAVDPDRRAVQRRRRVLALAALRRMGRRGVAAVPSLVRYLPRLDNETARECVLAIGEIGPFANLGPNELKVTRPWKLGPGYTVARMRLMMGPRPSARLVHSVLGSCPIAALQVLQRGMCPDFDDADAVVAVFRASSKGFAPRASAMPWDVYHQHKTRLAWQLEEAAATVVRYTDRRRVLIEAYEVLLYHRDWQMRSRAARRLYDLAGDADGELLALHVTYALADHSPVVQRALLRLIPRLASEALASLPAVRQHLGSRDPGVRQAARDALGALRPHVDRVLAAAPAAVRPLERFAAFWPDVPEPIAREALRLVRAEDRRGAAIRAWIRGVLDGPLIARPGPGQVAIGLWRLRAVVDLLSSNGAASIEYVHPVFVLLGRLKNREARLAVCALLGSMGPEVGRVLPDYQRRLTALVESNEDCAILAEVVAAIEVPETATKAELIQRLDNPNGLVRRRCLALLARHRLDETGDAAAIAEILRAMRGQHWIRIPGVDRNGGRVTRDVRAAAAQLLWDQVRSPGLRLQAARTLYEWGSVAQRRAVAPFFVSGKPAELTRLLRWCLAKEEDPLLVADALALVAQARPPLAGISRQLWELRKSDDRKLAAMASRVFDDLSGAK